MTGDDPFDLRRFVEAQDRVIDAVRAELAAGRKRTHWMWFVFPQLAGLGRSPMARAYAISSPEEARAYLAHPVLGTRLRECVGLFLSLPNPDARAVFGDTDAMKLRSCLSLFAAVSGEALFRDALEATVETAQATGRSVAHQVQRGE